MSGQTIAIVGAGFSGTTLAIHLLRAAPPGLDRLYLVERAEGRVGGVAYRTRSASHTLNVPAGRMVRTALVSAGIPTFSSERPRYPTPGVVHCSDTRIAKRAVSRSAL